MSHATDILTQDETNMNELELSNELKKLNDDDFKIIIKDFDIEKLNIIQALLIDPMHKMRIMQELQFRKENSLNLEEMPKIEKPTEKLQLIPTPDGIAPIPNIILRSSLFSASKTHGAEDQPVRDFEINTYGNDTKISMTGYRQFSQLDLDLVLQINLLQQQQDNPTIEVTQYKIIKNTKESKGHQTYLQIKEQLEFLQNASIKIKIGKIEFIGSILNNAYFNDETQTYIIEPNPKLMPFYKNNNWTGLDTNIRKQLKTNLAKWLHGFYSSHINSGIPLKLDTIYKLSGSTDTNIRRWTTKRLKDALLNLEETYLQNDMKFKHKIEKNLLYVHKTQSNSQNKNMIPKIKKKNSNKYNPKA